MGIIKESDVEVMYRMIKKFLHSSTKAHNIHVTGKSSTTAEKLFDHPVFERHCFKPSRSACPGTT
jgi:hypothetical protein